MLSSALHIGDFVVVVILNHKLKTTLDFEMSITSGAEWGASSE